MTKYIILTGSNDKYLTSSSATYSQARGGTGTTSVSTTLPQSAIGQSYSGGLYAVYEAFFDFDTSGIPASEVVSAADLLLHCTFVGANYSTSGGNGVRVFGRTWTPPLTSGQFASGNTLNALPDPQNWYPSNSAYVQNANYHIPMNPLYAGINQGGHTYLVATSHDVLANNTPTGVEYVMVTNGIAGSNQPTLVITTTVPSKAHGVRRAMAQLSTGETVEARNANSNATIKSSSPSIEVGYYTKYTNTWNLIATVVNSTGQGFTLTPDLIDLCVDGSDNIYLIQPYEAENYGSYLTTLIKGAGLTWTVTWQKVIKANRYERQSIKMEWIANNPRLGSSDTTGMLAVVECTGGVSDASTISSRTSLALVDLSIFNSDTSAYLDAQTAYTPYFLASGASGMYPTTTFLGEPAIEVQGAKIGSVPTIVIAVMYEAAPGGTAAIWASIQKVTYSGGAYVITASGTPKTVSTASGGVQVDAKLKLLKVGTYGFAIMGNYVSGKPPAVAIIDTSTNVTSSGAISSLSNLPVAQSSGTWDAYYDDVAAVIYMYYCDTVTAGRVGRLPYRMTTRAWDDPSDTAISTTSFTTGINTSIKTAHYTVDNRNVHVVVDNNNSGTYARNVYYDTFNVAPNAPIFAGVPTYDKNVSKTINWTFSDPNPKDSQLKYEIEIDLNSTGAAVIHTGVVTSGTRSYTITANALAQNTTYRIRIRTYDQQNATGAWTGYSTFQTSDVGSIAITDPVDDLQTGNSASYLVKWTYTTTGGATQAKYQFKMIRVSDSAVLLDSGLVTSTAAQYLIVGIPSGVPVRFDVFIQNTLAQNTAVVSRLFTTSYLAPDQVTNLNATINGCEIDLSWTVPTPTGARGYPSSVAVYRSIDDGATFALIGRVDPSLTTFIDAVPPSRTSPQYYVVSEIDTGNTISNIAAPGLFTIYGICLNPYTGNSYDPWDVAIYLPFGASGTGESTTITKTQLQFQGRTRPVAAYGDSGTHTLKAKSTVPLQGNPINGIGDTNFQTMFDIQDQIESIIAIGQTVCFRDGRGRRVFGTLSGYDPSDNEIGADISFGIDETSYDESLAVS